MNANTKTDLDKSALKLASTANEQLKKSIEKKREALAGNKIVQK